MAQEYSPSRASSLPLVIVYWAVVGIPLCWGIYKTVDKSIPLFNSASIKTVGVPTATPATAPAVMPVSTAASTPNVVSVPPPEASPFSTVQPSATVAPIDTPVVPKT